MYACTANAAVAISLMDFSNTIMIVNVDIDRAVSRSILDVDARLFLILREISCICYRCSNYCFHLNCLAELSCMWWLLLSQENELLTCGCYPSLVPCKVWIQILGSVADLDRVNYVSITGVLRTGLAFIHVSVHLCVLVFVRFCSNIVLRTELTRVNSWLNNSP